MCYQWKWWKLIRQQCLMPLGRCEQAGNVGELIKCRQMCSLNWHCGRHWYHWPMSLFCALFYVLPEYYPFILSLHLSEIPHLTFPHIKVHLSAFVHITCCSVLSVAIYSVCSFLFVIHQFGICGFHLQVSIINADHLKKISPNADPWGPPHLRWKIIHYYPL